MKDYDSPLGIVDRYLGPELDYHQTQRIIPDQMQISRGI